MATYTRYVNTASTAGGDGTTNETTGTTRAYASFDEAEAAGQALATVSTDVFICYVDGAGGDDAISLGVAIAGWTDGVDIQFIQNPVGLPYSLVSTSEAIRQAEDYLTLDGFKLVSSSLSQPTVSSIYGTFTAADNNLIIKNCVLEANASPTSSRYEIHVSVANLIADIYNCSSSGGARALDSRNAASVNITYCSFLRLTDQIGLVCDSEATIKNTYSGKAAGSNQDFWTGGDAPSGNNNISSDTTATTDFTSSLVSKAPSAQFVNITSGSVDLHLITGSDCEGAGVAIGGITTDADGHTRDATTPDVGYDELIPPAFQDEFTEASGLVALTSHTPTTTGVSWSALAGNAGSNAEIDATTDTLYQPYHGGALEYNGYLANISGTWGNDQRASRKLTTTSNANISLVAVRLHADGTTGKANGYAATHNQGTNNWTLYRLDSGVATILGLFFDNAASDTDVVAIEAIGTTIRLYENGIMRIVVTDATYSTGSPGLALKRTGSITGGAVDDFLGYDLGGGGVPVSASHSSALESVTGLSINGMGSVESVSGVSAGVLSAMELLLGVGVARGAITESTSAVGGVVTTVLESRQGLIAVSRDISSAVESVQSVAVARATPAESVAGLAAVSRSVSTEVESLCGVMRSQAAPFAVLAGMSRAVSGELETVARVVVSGALAAEVLTQTSRGLQVSAEALAMVSAAAGVSVEALGAGIAPTYEDLELLLRGEQDLVMVLTDVQDYH